jgi:glycosyltransferase involved in cell wall biosynthesis
MRILLVTLGFYPATAWGGPVKIVYQNGRELARRGHQVTVYCTNLLDKKNLIAPGTFERQVDGLRVVYFDTWRIPFWPGTLGPVWLPHLPDYLRRELPGFDIVHVNGYRNLMALPVARQARKVGVPLVVQPHGGMPVVVNSFLVKRLYDRLLGQQELRGLAALVALQESERQQALLYRVPPEKIHVIPNGLDLGEVQPLPSGAFRTRLGIPDERRLILFLARINRKKGADMLVPAFSLLNDLDVHLAIAGPDDGQLAEVRQLVQDHSLQDRVSFPGLLEGEDVQAAFQDADLFVLPCRTDTFPTTIMEACQANTPMVITEGCEIAHLVRDRVAEVTPFDPQAFANAMRSLLTDAAYYSRLQAECPQVMADTFSLQASVDRLEALYTRLSAARRNAKGAA